MNDLLSRGDPSSLRPVSGKALVSQTVSSRPDGRFLSRRDYSHHRSEARGKNPRSRRDCRDRDSRGGPVGTTVLDDPLVSLLRSERFFGGRLLSTNILHLRGSWACAMRARLKRVASTQPFGSCEDHLWDKASSLRQYRLAAHG